jgi:hypothetical protein
VKCRPALVDGYMMTSHRFWVVSSLYDLEADQKLGMVVTADVLLDDIVERSTRRYLVTKVLISVLKVGK